MAVIYLFDNLKRLKKPVRDVVEIIHTEGEYKATAELRTQSGAQYGDSFGFRCADGRFRLFWIDSVEKNDEAGYIALTGYDAALAELNSRILPGLALKNTTVLQAAQAALAGTGWSIGQAEDDAELNIKDAYFETLWGVLRNIAAAGRVRVVPYYEFAGGEIVGRKIDLQDRTPRFRGMILTRKKGAQNIHILKEGTPFGRVYPVGKIIGSGDPPEQVTIADAVWSRANGDPADKPAGQLYVDLPGALTDAEYKFEDKKEENPLELLRKGFDDLQQTAKPKATGTATIGDVEHVPGYEHRAVRMWDLLPVRTGDGETVEATVTNIVRYHVHRELTKVTIGNEDEDEVDLESLLAKMSTMLEETAKAAGGAGAGAGKAENMVLEATESITLNSQKIALNAEEIKLRASTARVDELESKTIVEFSEVYLDIDETRAELSATEQHVNNLDNTVTGLNATLTVQAGQIAAKASQYELDELGNRVTTAESSLTVQAGQIESKVSKDGVISSINQTAESIKIQAKKIELSGYVTSSMLSAEIVSLQNAFADSFGTFELSATNIGCATLRVDGNEAQWYTSPEFVKKVTLKGTSSFAVKDTGGIVHTIYAGYSITTDKDSVTYLGR